MSGLATNATQSFQTVTVFCDTTPLTLAFTNLPAFSGSRPFIDPAGYTTRALSALTWTVVDATGATNTGDGMVVAQGWSLADPYHVTNWFQCVDLALALGTNWVSIQAVDWAGTVAVTNFAYVFDTNGDITPPGPDPDLAAGRHPSQRDTFTVQAWMDDDTAAVALQYTDTNGMVQTVNGLVERGGNVWVQNVPLAAGTNSFSLTATDAAGNVSTNNFSVVQSSVALTINPLSQTDLQYGYATVTGDGWRPGLHDHRKRGAWGSIMATAAWEVDNVPLAAWRRGGVASDGAVRAPLQLNQQRQLRAAASPAGRRLQTLLQQQRGPIVFTQTYSYKLDYSVTDWTWQGTNAIRTHHIDFQWARGTGGTDTETLARIAPGAGMVSSTVLGEDVASGQRLYAQPARAGVGSYYWNGVFELSTTSAQSSPLVQWMEKSTSSGAWPIQFQANWAESSSRQVHLFTGGSPMRQQQGLFNVSASLSYESVLDTNRVWATGPLTIRAWFTRRSSRQPRHLWSCRLQQISLGALGNLGNDGHLEGSRSNGSELVITSERPRLSYIGQLPSA